MVLALAAAFIMWAVSKGKKSGGIMTPKFEARPAQRKEDTLYIRANIPHSEPPPSKRQCGNSTEFYIVNKGEPDSLARCILCTEEFYVTWKDEEWVLAK